MKYIAQHWSFDPFVVIVVITVIANELGLGRLREHSLPARTRKRRKHSLVFYSGLVVLLIAIDSPVDYWSSNYFFVHMIEHLLLMFAAPILIVAGAPWIPLMFAFPVAARRRVGRFFYLSDKARGFRACWRFVRSPWFAVISFNATMVLWHIPALFDLAERNSSVHVWAMHGSFLVTGVLFWLQIIDSYPMKPARGAVWQASSIIATNVVMTLLAISMSILTTVSWYATYSHVPGVSMSPFADQQIGAAILWVCGDFWALPALIVILRRAISEEGSFSNVIDRLTGRTSALTLASFRPTRQPTAPSSDTMEETSEP